MRDIVFDSIVNKFDSVYSIYITIAIVLSGFFLLIHDARRLKMKKCHKEQKIAKFLGYLYIVGGLGLYAITFII